MTAHSCLQNSLAHKCVSSDISAATWIHLHYYLPVKLASWEIYSCTIWSKSSCSRSPNADSKNDTLCWHQLNIILLKHPFVVGFHCRIIQLSKWPAIYFRGLSGERAAAVPSGSSSGIISSHHSGADVFSLLSAGTAHQLSFFSACKWGS